MTRSRYAKTRPHGIEESAARLRLDERVKRPRRPLDRPFPEPEPVETVWLLAGNGVVFHVPAGSPEYEHIVREHAAVVIDAPEDAA